MSLLSRLTVFLFLVISFSISQDLTVWVDNVRIGDELPEGVAEIRINIDLEEGASITSFDFTLDAFNSVFDSGSIEIDSGCLAASIFGTDNVHYNGNNFYGGSLNQQIENVTGDAPFLTIIASYDLNSSNNYISFGNDEETSEFYTNWNETIVNHEWTARTWVIGTDDTHDWGGEDCLGEIQGDAEFDDCNICSGGNTGHDANSDMNCLGECFGGETVIDELGECCYQEQITTYYPDSDGDGFGEAGFSIDACEQPEGYVDNSDDQDSECDGDRDACGVCEGNNVCSGNMSDDMCDGEFQGSDFDCTGTCFGSTEELDWYEDCDGDNQADGVTDFGTYCGEPSEEQQAAHCESSLFDSGLILIDPVGYNFDSFPDCPSNGVDECGECDGYNLYLDCNGVCGPHTAICEQEPNSDICTEYVGVGSDHQYAFNGGMDVCGECGGDNSSCSGCTDVNAVNHDDDALFDDGSCEFQLYPGDVNRDGIVSDQDIDGISIYWHNYGSSRPNQDIDWHAQITYDNYWCECESNPDDCFPEVQCTGDNSSNNSCAMFADTDGNGFVDQADITAIILNWGKQVPSHYYYPWGQNSDYTPACLEADSNQRENFETMYDFVLNNYPYNSENQEIFEYLANALGINIEAEYLPDSPKLLQNVPNPFNPSTKFPLTVPNTCDVELKVFDLNGRVLYQSEYKGLEAGVYSSSNSPFSWDGGGYPSGVYVYQFNMSTGYSARNKMMLIK